MHFGCHVGDHRQVEGFERRLFMKTIKNIMSRLVRDEQGGEVLEYALIAGLIVVAAIAVITSVGTKVLARWQSLNSSM
jgi:Flp pilus assembly pilin Flp